MNEKADDRPIETAPRDGTRILLIGGYYLDEFDAKPGDSGPAPVLVHCPMTARWVELDDREPDGFWLIVQTEDAKVEYSDPTHWRPLS